MEIPAMTRRLVLLVVLAVIFRFAEAQVMRTEHILGIDPEGESPPATLDAVAWLAGSWSGEAFGGTFEEVWTPASSGSMVGLFKLAHDGVPSIYEIQLIVEEEGTLVWKVKHFNNDFSAWEEKSEYVSFPLVKVEPDTVYFDGLTLTKNGANLVVFLSVGHGDEVREEMLTYRPLALSSEHEGM
jgi:hypothetical protein